MKRIQANVIKTFLISFMLTGILFGTVIFSGIANAKCDSAEGDTACVQQNFKDVQNSLGGSSVTPQQFQDAVNACQNTSHIGSITGVFNGNAPVSTPNTNQGNCSNAVRSCFLNENDTEACMDKDVLALITRCNNGDINAAAQDSEKQCGVDAAIDDISNRTGKNYATNSGSRDAYIKKQQEAACDDASLYPDPASRTACQEKVKGQVNTCYDSAGGVATKFDISKINTCMASNAQNQAQCTASGGGTWVPAGTARDGNSGQVSSRGECTPPVVAEPCKDHGGGQPDASGNCPDGSKPNTVACLQNATQTGCAGTIEGGTKQCGQASTNIIGCGSDQGATALSNVLRIFVIVLTFGVGIAATGSIAYSAIRYAGARDNQSDVSLARERIRNVVIGLLLYGFLIAIANWLVPGGIF